MTTTPGPGHNNPPEDIDIAKRIGQYVALRDKKKAIQDKHKAELKPYNDALETLEMVMLGYLNQINTDNTSAKGVGTVYKTIKKSASIADGAEFQRHVIGTESWNLIDWKANATAVETFMQEHEQPVPGVNFTQHVTVGVRRA